MFPEAGRFRSILAHYGIDVIFSPVSERLEEEQILAYAGQYDGTICGDDRYTARALEACAPRLKVIAKWGTGIDSIDREAAARLGIQVRNTPNAFTLPVADSVLGYILTFARQLLWMDRTMKRGVWEKVRGRSLSECTLGVVGMGNIGKAVLRRARPFGMKLLGNDIIPIAPDFILENTIEMAGLRELLGRADFISLNCDLNPTSYHLINAETLSWVKPGAVLINLARGPVVDEPALVAALQSGALAGAALDVYEIEPLASDSPLLQMDQVLLAPHNANSSPSAWERVHLNTLRNLLEGLGIPPANLEELLKGGLK